VTVKALLRTAREHLGELHGCVTGITVTVGPVVVSLLPPPRPAAPASPPSGPRCACGATEASRICLQCGSVARRPREGR
jgi:hypothetical protein